MAENNILTLLHSLIADGTIPYGGYGLAVDNGKISSGQSVIINSNTFTAKCIQSTLIDLPLVEGACLDINSLNVEVELTYLEGKWQVTRVWKSPIKRGLPATR